MKRTIILLVTLVALGSGAVACGRGRTPTPTPTPLPVQAPGWEGVTVHTLCLEVEQSYPQIEKEFSQPIAEATQRILARLGLQVVAPGEACDATLSISLTGQALAANYRGGVWWAKSLEAGGRFYTGAEVNGQMSLIFPGHEPLTLPISGMVPTPDRISGTYGPDTPAEAPFGYAWSKALLDGLAHLWGYQVLIQAVEDNDVYVCLKAVRDLAEVGPEEGVLPALIWAVEHERGSCGIAAARVLGDMGPEAKEAIPALTQALRGGKVADWREAAAYALAKIGPEAVPALFQVAEDHHNDIWVRCDAIDALGDIGPEAVPVLIQILRDDSDQIRMHAAGALIDITGQHFGHDADRWQQWWEEQAPVMGTPSGGVITYTVQAGDTLAKIAAEFGVTVEEIVEANDIEDPSLINVGQVLVIPKP